MTLLCSYKRIFDQTGLACQPHFSSLKSRIDNKRLRAGFSKIVCVIVQLVYHIDPGLFVYLLTAFHLYGLDSHLSHRDTVREGRQEVTGGVGGRVIYNMSPEIKNFQ